MNNLELADALDKEVDRQVAAFADNGDAPSIGAAWAFVLMARAASRLRYCHEMEKPRWLVPHDGGPVQRVGISQEDALARRPCSKCGALTLKERCSKCEHRP